MSRVKAIVTSNTTATAKKSFDIDAINAKANSKKQTASKKQNSKQTVSKKQNSKQTASTTDVKLSAYKNACRLYASLNETIDADNKKLVHQLIADVARDDFHVVCKDTTSCALFIVDNNKNTVCNVYDCMRIQFTTVQARKYKNALLADSRFYTHLYKNNEFISCKCATYSDFVSAMQYVYSVYINSKQTATATEQTATEAKAK